jgi:hypothetical protein
MADAIHIPNNTEIRAMFGGCLVGAVWGGVILS